MITPRCPHRYTTIAILLHWLVALCVLGLLVIGVAMVWAPPEVVNLTLKFNLYQWHKSLGITVFVLMFLRLLWRLTHKAPPLPDTLTPVERFFARLTHYGLYILLGIMPLTGWAVVSTASFNVPTLIFQTFHLPHISYLAMHPDKASLSNLASTIHLTLAISIASLIALHIAGALKHHFVDRDDVLRRMLPSKFIKSD